MGRGKEACGVLFERPDCFGCGKRNSQRQLVVVAAAEEFVRGGGGKPRPAKSTVGSPCTGDSSTRLLV